MDPRPERTDPLTVVETDLDALDSAPADEQIDLYSRIHSALASALAGTATDPANGTFGQSGPGPGS